MFPKGVGVSTLPESSVWPHADRVIEEAARLLDERDRTRPFFLYLHFMDVHEYASPPHFKIFGAGARGHYLAAIRWVDDAAARVREQLDAAGVLDRTVIVLAADHGETFEEHGVHGHARNVLTPVVWVPLVIRFPFRLTPPIRVATQVRNLDIAPTLLEIAGLPVPAAFEGESLVPLFTDDAAADRPSYAALGAPLFPDASVQTTLNDGRWVYARNAEATEGAQPNQRRPVAPGAEFLFDRSVDSGENVNLIAHEPAQAARMRALLDEHLARQGARAVEPGVEIDPAIAERLRAMGYLR
jgi:arylsulfatase A-like enzyme